MWIGIYCYVFFLKKPRTKQNLKGKNLEFSFFSSRSHSQLRNITHTLTKYKRIQVILTFTNDIFCFLHRWRSLAVYQNIVKNDFFFFLIMMCKVVVEVKIIQVRLRLMMNKVFCLGLSLMIIVKILFMMMVIVLDRSET